MRRTGACDEMVRMFEGLRLEPYRDAVGIWTVGYGHVILPDEKMEKITVEQAQRLLALDLDVREAKVSGVVDAAQTSVWEFDALLSFAFNLGVGALRNSTLLTAHNAGLKAAAVKEFRRWVNAGGRKLPGLVKRRHAEAVRYLGGDEVLVRAMYEGVE